MKEIVGNIIRSIYYKTGYMDEFQEEAGYEITSLIIDFIKWKDDKVGSPNKNGIYLYWEDHYTIEKLFEYWYQNIRHDSKLLRQ